MAYGGIHARGIEGYETQQRDIIGIAPGREVAAALGERTLVEIPQAGHNDVWMTDVPLTRTRTFISDQAAR